MFKGWNNITKISLISFFSVLYFYLPILTIYYQQRNLNFVQINSLWGIIAAAIFLTEIPTGVIADKIGRKNSIIISLVLQILGEVLFLFAQNYFHFVLISILAGVGFAFQSGCLQALVYDSLKEKGKEGDMKKAQGTVGAFYQAGHLIGAFGSSFIIAQITKVNIQFAIILTAVSVLIAFLISLTLKEPKLKYEHREQDPLKILKDSFKLIRNNRSLKRLILFGVFTTPFINYLRNLQPPYFQLSGVNPSLLGLSLTIGGILAILASKYAYKVERVLGMGRSVLLATILPAALYILMAFIIHPIGAVVLFILNFGSMSLQDPLLADYTNQHINSNIRATTLSIIGMFSSIYITFVGLLVGWVADHSILYAFTLMGVIVLFGAIFFRISEKHLSYSKGN